MDQTLRLQLYTPHPKQREFHNSKQKFLAAITGVGFGKTALLVTQVLMDAIKAPALYLLFAPTFPMLRNIILPEFFKWCPKRLILDHNRSEHKITLINGAVILYLSGDNERNIEKLRGLNLGGFGMDEAAITSPYVWDILIARLRDPKGTLRGYITTTPKGFNWVYNLFVEGKNWRGHTVADFPQNYKLIFGSTMDNIYTPEEYKQSLVDAYSGTFAEQEIYGKFVGFEGLVYDEFTLQKNVGVFHKKFEEGKFTDIIAAVDWGYTNPFAMLAIGFDNDGRAYVLDEFYKTKTLTHDKIRHAQRFRDKYDIGMFECDPAEPALIEDFNQNGLEAEGANNDIMPGITLVNSLFKPRADGKPRLFIDQKCVNLIRELSLYRYPDPKEERNLDEKPIDKNNHALDALRYALMSREGGSSDAEAFSIDL